MSLEKIFLGKADFIVTVSEPLLEKLQTRHKTKHCILIENGFDADEHPNFKNNFSKLKSINKKKVNFVYTGLLSNHRNPEVFIKYIIYFVENYYINPSQIAVDFYGSNSEIVDNILKLYDEKFREIFRTHEQIPREKILKIQRSADYLLLFESSSIKNQGNLTGKIFEYMVTGNPIIAFGTSSNHSISKTLKHTGTGVGLDNEDDNKIKQCLHEILVEQTNNFYSPNIEHILYYSISRQIKRLLEITSPSNRKA